MKKAVKKTPKKRVVKKIGLDIEIILDLIIEGFSYRDISKKLGVPLSTLHDFTSKAEHSARARTALEYSASTYSDKAEEVLKKAKRHPVEMTRARELAQYYKWLASKRAPKIFGDKLDVTTKGNAIKTFKIGFKKPDEDQK